MKFGPINNEMSTTIVEFLEQASSYRHQPTKVELLETHISWVFLAGRYAYKLKKPVRFDFLDFSTIELRRKACEAELRLNRRISPSVYRAVVPITLGDAGFALGGKGQIVDWVVKMRRLDDHCTLAALLKKRLGREELAPQFQPVAARLAVFYTNQPPLMITTHEFREHLQKHIHDNETQLVELAQSEKDGDTIRRIHGAQKRFLAVEQDLLDDRVRDGRIVDGHGDLRPEHIYLGQCPQIIDCVEFNAEYRANDIIDELAFLAMECDRLGASWVGDMLFKTYADESQDAGSDKLANFYKSYRACVRAKVAALRCQQQYNLRAESSLRSERCYLQLAAEYVRHLGPRIILMVGGLSGMGKSTLAAQLGQVLSAEVVSSDVVRRTRQVDSNHNEHSQEHFGNGRYTFSGRIDNYRTLVSTAREAFGKSDVIIIDATFSHRAARRMVIELAAEYNATALQIECSCPRDVAMQRISDRLASGNSTSEALPEFYDLQAAHAELPLADIPLAAVDTTYSMGLQTAIVLGEVRNLTGSTAPV